MAGELFILIQPKGQKHWRLAYRFNGKQKLLAGGPYPAVSLATARRWRETAKIDLAAGRDPSEIRKAAKRQAVRRAESKEHCARRENST